MQIPQFIDRRQYNPIRLHQLADHCLALVFSNSNSAIFVFIQQGKRLVDKGLQASPCRMVWTFPSISL